MTRSGSCKPTDPLIAAAPGNRLGPPGRQPTDAARKRGLSLRYQWETPLPALVRSELDAAIGVANKPRGPGATLMQPRQGAIGAGPVDADVLDIRGARPATESSQSASAAAQLSIAVPTERVIAGSEPLANNDATEPTPGFLSRCRCLDAGPWP